MKPVNHMFHRLCKMYNVTIFIFAKLKTKISHLRMCTPLTQTYIFIHSMTLQIEDNQKTLLEK